MLARVPSRLVMSTWMRVADGGKGGGWGLEVGVLVCLGGGFSDILDIFDAVMGLD